METRRWTPADLLQLSGGYWAACALHAGVKLDIFTPLSAYPHSAAALAELLDAEVRGVEMLLDALTAMVLLEKQDSVYSATCFAAEYLSKTSPNYLGYIIGHHHHLMSFWTRLHEAVIGGGPLPEPDFPDEDEENRQNFLMGMFNLAMQAAPRIVPHIDLTGRKRLLDLGGGPGTYAIQFCRNNPGLAAVVFDLPSTRPFAEETIERFGVSHRISFTPGDYLTDDLGRGFDVAWLSHILHAQGPDECAVILRKAVAALEPDGLILVQEFILDNTMDGPLFPALFSLNMLLRTPTGRAYSEAQLMEMLAASGVGELRRIPLDLPTGAGVISGVVVRP